MNSHCTLGFTGVSSTFSSPMPTHPKRRESLYAFSSEWDNSFLHIKNSTKKPFLGFLFLRPEQSTRAIESLAMAKKRKSDATRLEEVDRTMYTSFCSAANSLSQLYTQSMNQQRLSFQAGERHGLEKLYDWILRQQENGSRVNPIDILAYLQNELEYGLEEHQHPQTAMHLANTSFPVSSTSFGPTTAAQGPRSAHFDHHQPKNVFSNALSSPVRRSLQQYHLPQGNYFPNNVMQSGSGLRNNETNFPNNQIRDSNDLLMDMHSDSPGRES